MQDANILKCSRPPAGFDRPSAHPLDAEEIFVRVALGQRAEEGALAAAQVNMQRCDATKNFL